MSLKTVASKRAPLFVASIAAILAVIVFGAFVQWRGLAIKVQVKDLAGLLAPLAFTAAVVERAVEVMVSPWRDTGASKLDKAITAIKARPANPETDAQNAAALKTASDALDEYRGVTQQYAFAVSLTLSVLVSIAGVRALGPFVDTTQFNVTASAQQLFFLCVDVALSAALLAGGADGIHSVVNAVTCFFDATASKVSQL